MTQTLFETFKQTALEIDSLAKRNIYFALSHAMSELGETAEEIAIVKGDSYKQAGPDGVVGEAIDTIMCMMDIIHIHAPELTEDDLVEIANRKCAKWKSKVSEHKWN